MGYRRDMERCRAYIEEHLLEEITPRELSELFSYSFFHFCHVFKSVNGEAVYGYIRSRRLLKAAEELQEGASVTELTFKYGFDTVSGFTRAFQRQFSMTPTEYKKLKGGNKTMTPEIKKFPGFRAIGYALKPESDDIDVKENGAYWHGKDFSSVPGDVYAALCIPNQGELGTWLHPSDKTGDFYYFLGTIVTDEKVAPEGLVEITAEEAEYAVFTVEPSEDTHILAENIKKTWKYVFEIWFDSSEYQFDQGKMDFEFYYEEGTYIYVPVVKK